MNASDVLVDRLIEWGVDTIFGLPGDGINGVFEALRKTEGNSLHSRAARGSRPRSWPALMRSSPAALGVCIATSGPGGIHLLNGLYDAKMDGAPVLAITGMQHSDLIGTFRSAGCGTRQAVHGCLSSTTSA